jgi:hypothetical protein
MPTSVGPDGIDVTGYGWTNQSSTFNSNKSLESYGAASSSIINSALRSGYSAWSYDPALSLAAGISTDGVTFVAEVFVPQTFVSTKVDWIQVSGTNSVTVGLWTTTAPAGTATPLAWTLATGTAATAAAVNTLAWSTGASSPTSVVLTGGQSYLVTLAGSAAAGVVGCLTGTASGVNANAFATAWSTTTTYRAATLGTQLLSITGASTFGTSTLSADLVWIGLH